jgi:hypothetical protein
MPKIQQYTAQVNPGGAGGSLASPGAFGTGANAGDAFSKVGAFIEQKQERDQFFQMQKDMAQVRGDWTQRLGELEANAAPGAPDFTKNLVTEYDAAMEKMRAERPLPRNLADRLELEQLQTRNALLSRATAFEAQAKAQKRRTDALGYQSQASRNVFLDPGMFSVEMERLPGALEALGLSGNALEAFKQGAAADLAENAVKGLIDRGRLDLAREAIKAGPIAEQISGDKAAVFSKAIDDEEQKRAAEAARARREATAAALDTVRLGFADTLASIERTGKDPGLLDPQTIRTAYADNPGQAERLLGQISNAKSFYTVRQNVALTSPEEDQRVLNDLAAKVGGVNAAQTGAQLDQYIQAITAKKRALADDSFGYVVNSSPRLQQMLAEGSQDPQKFRAAISYADQLQANLGVQPWARTYLGTQAASGMVASINAATPEKAADEIENMAKRYGDLWPNVVNELAGKGLNPAYTTVARLTQPTDASIRTDLVSALNAGPQTLRDNLAVGTDAKDISEGVRSRYADFASTLRADGAAGQKLLANEITSAEMLAMLYRQRGDSVSTAVRKATDALVNNRYDFEGTFRAPKGVGSQAARAAEMTLGNLTAEQFAPVAGGDPNLSETYRRAAALDYARRGTWANTPNGDGIELLFPNGSPVVLENGQRVRLMFNALPQNPTTQTDADQRRRERMIREENELRRAGPQ